MGSLETFNGAMTPRIMEKNGGDRVRFMLVGNLRRRNRLGSTAMERAVNAKKGLEESAGPQVAATPAEPAERVETDLPVIAVAGQSTAAEAAARAQSQDITQPPA